MPLTCDNCCYYWQEDYERYATCHFGENIVHPDQLAPCEEDYYMERYDISRDELYGTGEEFE